MKDRTLPQVAKFHAIVGEVAHQFPLIPFSREVAEEAWKRHFLKLYVLCARLEAYGAGQPDPFPVRPVPSSALDSQQYSELIECTTAYCATNGIHLSK